MLENIWYKIYLFIYLFIHLQTSPRDLEQSQSKPHYEVQKITKNNNIDNTNTNNNDSALVETIETEITNRIGANINERINNTFDGASWSVAE